MHEDKEYELIEINDKLNVTPEHLIYTNDGWKKAGELTLDDILLNSDGKEEPIDSLETFVEKTKVYNLHTEKNHNYFAEGLLVHNKIENVDDQIIDDLLQGIAEESEINAIKRETDAIVRQRELNRIMNKYGMNPINFVATQKMYLDSLVKFDIPAEQDAVENFFTNFIQKNNRLPAWEELDQLADLFLKLNPIYEFTDIADRLKDMLGGSKENYNKFIEASRIYSIAIERGNAQIPTRMLSLEKTDGKTLENRVMQTAERGRNLFDMINGIGLVPRDRMDLVDRMMDAKLDEETQKPGEELIKLAPKRAEEFAKAVNALKNKKEELGQEYKPLSLAGDGLTISHALGFLTGEHVNNLWFTRALLTNKGTKTPDEILNEGYEPFKQLIRESTLYVDILKMIPSDSIITQDDLISTIVETTRIDPDDAFDILADMEENGLIITDQQSNILSQVDEPLLEIFKQKVRDNFREKVNTDSQFKENMKKVLNYVLNSLNEQNLIYEEENIIKGKLFVIDTCCESAPFILDALLSNAKQIDDNQKILGNKEVAVEIRPFFLRTTLPRDIGFDISYQGSWEGEKGGLDSNLVDEANKNNPLSPIFLDGFGKRVELIHGSDEAMNEFLNRQDASTWNVENRPWGTKRSATSTFEELMLQNELSKFVPTAGAAP